MHRTLEQVLRTLIEGNESAWCSMLPYAELYMNTTPNSSTGKSPHEIVYGRVAFNPFASILSNTNNSVPALNTFAASRQELWQAVHAAIEKSKQEQKRYADKHRSPIPFCVGSHVLLSTRNLQLKAFTSRKLAPRWIGPYRITAQHGTAITLELPPELAGLHSTFHAKLLRPYVGRPPARPPPILVDA